LPFYNCSLSLLMRRAVHAMINEKWRVIYGK
jgi:hypothetical protein